MPEQVYPIAAICAGACIAFAVVVLGDRAQSIDATAWLERVRHPRDHPGSEMPRPGPWSKALAVTGIDARLVNLVERAGWRESPERLTAFAVGLSASLAVIGCASGSMLGLAGAAVLAAIGLTGGLGLCSLVLRTAIVSRRRRLAGELIPLLELFTLELSGGGSALSALGTVSTRLQGELASDVRRLLIASQVVGSSPFEARLMRYSEQLEIPAIASLATILAASREYGTGALQGVRALATDLRHAQRRELIAQSRRALNHVLLPAGVGVLLPFLAVVMFPAVTALQRNLH
jgi:Flp pilus assembly protein TadB